MGREVFVVAAPEDDPMCGVVGDYLREHLPLAPSAQAADLLVCVVGSEEALSVVASTAGRWALQFVFVRPVLPWPREPGWWIGLGPLDRAVREAVAVVEGPGMVADLERVVERVRTLLAGTSGLGEEVGKLVRVVRLS